MPYKLSFVLLQPPLIITVALDKVSQDYFNELRTKHFPTYCNYMHAHVTFFHRLPSNLSLVDAYLQKITQQPCFFMEASAIKNIGNGTVFTITSNELQQLHKTMQKKFTQHLITQDRKKLWPHVTIQNKVTAYKAKQLTDELSTSFQPFKITAIGFSTWLYLKGPWQHKADYFFKQ